MMLTTGINADLMHGKGRIDESWREDDPIQAKPERTRAESGF